MPGSTFARELYWQRATVFQLFISMRWIHNANLLTNFYFWIRCDAKSKAITWMKSKTEKKKKYLTHVYCMCAAPYLCYFEFEQLLTLKMNQRVMRKTWIGTQTNTRIDIDVGAYGVCLFIVSHILYSRRQGEFLALEKSYSMYEEIGLSYLAEYFCRCGFRFPIIQMDFDDFYDFWKIH